MRSGGDVFIYSIFGFGKVVSPKESFCFSFLLGKWCFSIQHVYSESCLFLFGFGFVLFFNRRTDVGGSVSNIHLKMMHLKMKFEKA